MKYPNFLTITRKLFSKLTTPPSIRKIIHTSVNNYEILVLANEDVGRAIHFGRSFESQETALVKEFLKKDSVCLDVGANIGYFTLLMGTLAAEGKVYAFEPSPLASALLRVNVVLNSLDNVEIVTSAVSDISGNTSFVQSADTAYSSFLDTRRKALEKKIYVPVCTLDDFVSERNIEKVDILKIDVEGAEAKVLFGARRLLESKLLKPKLLIVELNDENLDCFGTARSEIVAFLEGYGYAAKCFDKHGNLTPSRFVKPFEAKENYVFQSD